MADTYIIDFTDKEISKTFSISPYTTNGSLDPTSTTLDSSAVSANTSLLFFGKGMDDYGERTAENFLHLLENFSGKIEPKHPINGQLWFDENDKVLKVLNINSLEIYDKDLTNKIKIRHPGIAGKKYQALFNAAIVSRFAPGFKFKVYGFDSITDPNFRKTLIGEFVVNSQAVSLSETEFEVELVTNANIKIFPTEIATNYTIGIWNPASELDNAKLNEILTDPLKNFTTFSVPTQDIDLGGYKLINVGIPSNPEDSITIAYADANYVNVSGDTMSAGSLLTTDDLSIGGSAIFSGTVDLTHTSGLNMNVHPIINLLAPVSGTDAANKQYVDNAITAGAGVIAGDFVTKTSGLTQTISSGDLVLTDQPEQPGQIVQSLGIQINHAATVGYVDNEISNALVIYNGNPAARFTIPGLITADGNVTYTAIVSGPPGQLITVTQLDPGVNSSPLSVNVVGNDITVSLATDATGTLISTGLDVFAIVNASGPATALVLPSTNPGTDLAGTFGPANLQLPTSSDIHVSAAGYNSTLDQLELFRTDGDGLTPDVIIPNLGAAISGAANNTALITHTVVPLVNEFGDAIGAIKINDSNFPNFTTADILTTISKTIRALSVKREQVVKVSDGRSTPYDIEADFGLLYTAGFNVLTLYVNGLKQIPNARGHNVITLDKTSNPSSQYRGFFPNTPTGLLNDATIYTANISVDGGANQLISLVGSENQLFYQFIKNINGGLLSSNGSPFITVPNQLVGARIVLEASKLIIYSNSTSAISAILITDINLFSSINVDTNVAVIETPIPGADYDYAEIGSYGITYSATQFQFNSVIPASSLIDINIAPVTGIKDVDGEAV